MPLRPLAHACHACHAFPTPLILIPVNGPPDGELVSTRNLDKLGPRSIRQRTKNWLTVKYHVVLHLSGLVAGIHAPSIRSSALGDDRVVRLSRGDRAEGRKADQYLRRRQLDGRAVDDPCSAKKLPVAARVPPHRAELHPPPGPDKAVVGRNDGVGVAAGNIDDLLALDSSDETRERTSGLGHRGRVLDGGLAPVVAAPGVDAALLVNGEGVVGSASNLDDFVPNYLAADGLGDQGGGSAGVTGGGGLGAGCRVDTRAAAELEVVVGAPGISVEAC